jgi:hypothetical protein
MSTERTEDATPVRPWEIAGAVLAAGVFVLLRWPLYTMPAIQLGWHSDAALLGLMARAIAAGDYPILFWATDYLAPLTSVFAFLAGRITGPIGPLALRIGTAVEIFSALLFCQAALRRGFGRRAAMLTTFWLVAGPAFLFKLTYAPLSAEQYFFVGSIAFWYTARTRFTRLHQWLILGLLGGLGWWIHRGVVFVIVPAIVTIVRFDRSAISIWRDRLAAAFAMAAGVLIGALPIAFGRLAIDQRLYLPVKAEWSIANVLERLSDTVTYDIFELLGARPWFLAIPMFVLLAWGIARLRVTRNVFLAYGVVLMTLAFWIFSTDAYRGAVRYIMIAVPILIACVASATVSLWDANRRVLAVLAMAVVTAGFYLPRHQQVRDVEAAKLEQLERWPGGFDPRPSLHALHDGGYTVCYANVWIAHKLEWLSEPTVRFIPYRSVNRRMVESLRLASTPGPKCFVDLDGHVRPLTQREERDARLDVLWSMYGWKRPFAGLR